MENKVNWIELSKEKPKQYATVLTYGHPNNDGLDIRICSYSDGIFRHIESDKEHKHTITHWAELPDTPTDVWINEPGQVLTMEQKQVIEYGLLNFANWISPNDVETNRRDVKTFLGLPTINAEEANQPCEHMTLWKESDKFVCIKCREEVTLPFTEERGHSTNEGVKYTLP